MGCWHNWSNWKALSEGKIMIDDKTVGRFIVQQRDCEKCGKADLATHRAYFA